MQDITTPKQITDLLQRYPVLGTFTWDNKDRYSIWRYDQEGNELHITIDVSGIRFEEKRKSERTPS